MKTIILSFFLLGLISAYAADLSDLQFGEIEWDDGLGPRYAVTNCNPEATGSISVPAEYNGTPITTIGDRAFASCHQLTEIHLEEGIREIGIAAFQNCTSLKHITLPTSLLIMWGDTFKNCESLTQITIPPQLRFPPGYDHNDNYYLDGYHFNNCTALTNVIWQTSDPRIPYSTFSGCHNLREIHLPPTIKHIEAGAFNQTGLEELVLPESLITIGNFAFSRCPALTNIVWNTQLQQIADKAFQYCSQLSTIRITEKVERIGTDVFKECTTLTSIIFDSNTNLLHIGDNTFFDCQNLQTVDFRPATALTNLGHKTFAQCANLIEVHFPESLTTLGKDTFIGSFLAVLAPLISEIHLPPHIRKIPSGTFYGCTNLHVITTASPIEYISDFAFGYNIKLVNFPFTEALTHIGEYAFMSCWNLEGGDFSPHLNFLGKSAFHGCKKITRAHLFDSEQINIIDRRTFTGCELLQEITLPRQLHSIRYAAFSGCAFSEITLPDSLRYAQTLAFSHNPNLERIVIPEKFIAIQSHCFSDCVSLRSIQFPPVLQRLGDSSFRDCYALEAAFYQGPAPGYEWTTFYDVTNLTHYVFADHYQSFIDAGYTNVVIVDDPFESAQANSAATQPEKRIANNEEPLNITLPNSPLWEHKIESTQSLTQPDWQTIPVEPQLTSETSTFSLPTNNTSNYFYRAVAYPTFLP